MRMIIIYESDKNGINAFCMETGIGERMKIRWQKIRILVLMLVFVMVNIWIINGLLRLKEQADMMSLSYPAGAVTETAFEQWKKSEDSEIFSEGAVWKACGDFKVLSEDTGHDQKVSCYQMKGQPAAVFGKELADGRYFTEGEKNVCLLDQDTVRQLFGSDNVLGLEVRMDEKNWQIAGVLKGSAPICVIPAEEGEVFDGITVRKKEEDQSVNQAVSIIEALFGSTDGQQIDGQLYYVLDSLLYFMILVVSLIVIGIAASRKTRKKPKEMENEKAGEQMGAKASEIGRRCILPCCLAAALVIMIAGVNAANPGSDYLPTYWSDFEFFSRLFRDKAEQIQSLAVHQEFFVWQKMFGLWRRVILAEVLAGALILLVCMDFLLHLRVRRKKKGRGWIASLGHQIRRVGMCGESCGRVK